MRQIEWNLYFNSWYITIVDMNSIPDEALVRSADRMETNFTWSNDMSDECLLAAFDRIESEMVESSLYHG